MTCAEGAPPPLRARGKAGRGAQIEQEFHRHQYRKGKVDIQAVHQRTTHLPTLQVPDLDRNHTHLQHIPPKPEPLRTPDWVPEDAPYISHDRAYHYPNPIQHLTRVLGDTDSRAHIQELQEKLKVPLYHSEKDVLD